jgi:hypothetical protein
VHQRASRHAAILGEEDVLGFDVAARDALLVCGTECADDLGRDVDRPSRCERASVEALAQRLALEQLHHRIDHPVCAAEVVNRQNARMRQRRDRERLTSESSEPLRIGGEGVRQNLDGDIALQLVSRARSISLIPPESRYGP